AGFDADPGALDLGHLGAEVGEHHRRERPGEDPREVKDLERPEGGFVASFFDFRKVPARAAVGRAGGGRRGGGGGCGGGGWGGGVGGGGIGGGGGRRRCVPGVWWRSWRAVTATRRPGPEVFVERRHRS